MLRQFTRQLFKSFDMKLIPKRRITTTQSMKKAEAAEGQCAVKTVLVEKRKNITLIGINRPEMRNAINNKTAHLICNAFSEFEADETSPVAVLYGVGDSFCSGFDIFELDDEKEEQISIELLMMQEGSVGPTRRQIKKPVVCSINGFCVANGLELALMCDLRVMEESAVIGFFNRRFGVPVIDGGTARLPAMIGVSRALDLILTGRPVFAAEAESMGIANRVVCTGTALEKSIELATLLARFPQSALNHDRNSLNSAVYESNSFGQAVQNEIMYTSKDIIQEMQEGIRWFNKTFKTDTSHWLKKQKSMADWDDDDVMEAADKIEEKKKADKAAIIEAEKQENEKNKEKEALKKNNKEPEKISK